MKKSIMKILAVAIATVAIAVPFALATQGHHAHSAKSVGSKSKGAYQHGPAELKNDPDAKVFRPVMKGGHKTRGAMPSTYYHVDNHTRWAIMLFLDGTYIGSVQPYGDSYGYQPDGEHSMYAEAPGTSLTWGPSDAYFDGSSFTWNLW